MNSFLRLRPPTSSLRWLSSAALLAGLTWVAPAQAADVVITENARSHFRAGVSFLQDPDGARYGEAYSEFKVAYAESPSWKILGNLGISAMKLERDGEAIEAFEIYLAESGTQIDAAERAQVKRDLDTLKAGVTWVTVRTAPAGGSMVDTRFPLNGQPVDNRFDGLTDSVRIGVHAGKHRINIELEGYETATWSFEAKGGEISHTFELVKKSAVAPVPATTGGQAEPAKTYEKPVPTGVYIGLAATGVFAAGATVTGIMALGKHSDFDNATSIADAESAKSSGETLNLTTDILIGAAVVSAATTAVLFFTRPEVEVGSVKDSAFHVAPVALPGGGGLWMQGRF